MLALGLAGLAVAQADRCRGAVSKLGRVKEEIKPELKDRDALEKLLSMSQDATTACPSIQEAWYYRAILAERLGDLKDSAYARAKIPQYTAQYDPFSPPPAAAITAEEYSVPVGKKWALVVGIDEFQDPRAPALRFAKKDSTDFATYLEDSAGGRFQPARVRHLTNKDATLQGIREGIGWLRENVQPEDLVVFYVSSHGSPRQIDPNGVSYVITYDSNLSSAEKLYASSLQMIELAQSINRDIRARRVVLILDTCFSGDATTSARVISGQSRGVLPLFSSPKPPSISSSADTFSAGLSAIRMGVGRAVLTASRAEEQSWEGEYKNGYFTYFLLQELRSEPGASLGGAFPVVRKRVHDAVEGTFHQQQNPTAEFGDSGASIVMSVPESK